MASAAGYSARPEPGAVDVPVLLVRWRTSELRLAHTFRECAGAGTAEIEELYDSTALALLSRPYESEEHLRAAIHIGIKMRALRLHRDRTAHRQTLAHAAPVIHATERARAFAQEPEGALIAQEDGIIIGEFLSELTPREREVFVLMADKRSWHTIAMALGIEEKEARTVMRSCERKRELFLTLYGTGRLCGFRSRVIAALLSGQQTGELALAQALTHLSHCRTCQTQHQTTNEQLRAAFEGRALAVLPVPVLLHTHAGLLDRLRSLLEYRTRVAERLAGPGPGTGIRERLAEAGTGAGAATKVALGLASIAALTGGTLDATHILDRTAPHHTRHANHAAAPQPPTAPKGTQVPAALLRQTFRSPSRAARPARRSPYPAEADLQFGPGEAIPTKRAAPPPRSSPQHEPGGFAYLGGVPTANAPRTASTRRAQTAVQHAGGAFSP
jgi:DNA-directed RNA polymerase specialized sigma24 family protein